jgi:hypothetical protein
MFDSESYLLLLVCCLKVWMDEWCSSFCLLGHWQTSLNAFMALGRPAWKEARATLQKLLSGVRNRDFMIHLLLQTFRN